MGARATCLWTALWLPLLMALSAPPAAAHGNSGNYLTSISSISPAVPGLEVSAASDGSSLTITNRTGRTVIVLGYDDEPYLKITAHGVWANSASPTAYANAGKDESSRPDSVSASAPPQWDEVSTSSSYRYHDHRIDWMGKGKPAVVAHDVNESHLIKRWRIDLLVDDTPIAVNGTLTWSPTGVTPANLLLLGVCGAVLVGAFAAIVIDDRRRKAVPDA